MNYEFSFCYPPDSNSQNGKYPKTSAWVICAFQKEKWPWRCKVWHFKKSGQGSAALTLPSQPQRSTHRIKPHYLVYGPYFVFAFWYKSSYVRMNFQFCFCCIYTLIQERQCDCRFLRKCDNFVSNDGGFKNLIVSVAALTRLTWQYLGRRFSFLYASVINKIVGLNST